MATVVKVQAPTQYQSMQDFCIGGQRYKLDGSNQMVVPESEVPALLKLGFSVVSTS